RYREAERQWADAARADPAWQGPFYNLACVAAIDGRLDDALGYLELMQKRGASWARLRRLETDPDLAALRARPDVAVWIEGFARPLFTGAWVRSVDCAEVATPRSSRLAFDGD